MFVVHQLPRLMLPPGLAQEYKATRERLAHLEAESQQNANLKGNHNKEVAELRRVHEAELSELKRSREVQASEARKAYEAELASVRAAAQQEVTILFEGV